LIPKADSEALDGQSGADIRLLTDVLDKLRRLRKDVELQKEAALRGIEREFAVITSFTDIDEIALAQQCGEKFIAAEAAAGRTPTEDDAMHSCQRDVRTRGAHVARHRVCA